MAEDSTARFIDLRTTVGAGSGRVIGDLCGAAKSLPDAPVFLLGHATSELLRVYFEQFETWAVSCYQVNQLGVTAEGVIVDRNSIYICNELNFHYHYIHSHWVTSIDLGDLPVTHRAGEYVLLSGPGHKMYGHWLVDFLPKLYVLYCYGLDIRRLKYILPGDTPQFALEWLRFLGILDEQFVFFNTGEITFVDSLIVPTVLRSNSRTTPLFADAIRYLKQLILGEKIISGGGKLFLARNLVNNKRLLSNRDRIEKIAELRGYHFVVPEKLSIREQIELFSSATLIVGEYGSNLHNSIFAPRNAMICALRTNDPHSVIGFLQSGLGQAMGQKTGYVFGASAAEEQFKIEEKDFQQALDILDVYVGSGAIRASEA